jgi:AcrR family transcriptional regulator
VIGLARTRKKPEERKLELVEAARRIFRDKGYTATNVTDIIREVGISQGTFYFYFEGKEAVFDPVAEAIVLEVYDVLKSIVRQESLSALDKIKLIMGYVMSIEMDERWTDEIAALDLRHMRYRVGSIAFDLATPLATEIIKQGVEEGLMHVLHPEATAAYYMTVSWAHFDFIKGTDILSREQWWEAYLDFVKKVCGIRDDVDFGFNSE